MRRNLFVHDIGQEFGIVRRQPVRKQFRHRRQHLHVRAVFDHVRQTFADVPRPGIDFAEHFAADHHRGLIACR